MQECTGWNDELGGMISVKELERVQEDETMLEGIRGVEVKRGRDGCQPFKLELPTRLPFFVYVA